MAELRSDPLLSREELERMRPDVEFAARVGFPGDSVNMAPTGFIHVIFLWNAHNSRWVGVQCQCAVYRAFHHPDDAPLSEVVFAVCRDTSIPFMAFVNEGIVMQRPAHPAALPEAGQMVRARKAWRFEREEGAWQSADLATWPVVSLWTHFSQW